MSGPGLSEPGGYPGLRVEGLSVAFGGEPVLRGLDLSVAPGEVLVLLGPSGCGKSTLLRSVAGLESLSAGRVWWADEDLTEVPTHLRDFGLVFQDQALFGHRDVAGNVGFALRVAGMPVDAIAQKVAEVLDLVGLTGFEDRRVDTLSGGEAQRVALARSLAGVPRLLLLDEPLGSLDRALRERLTDDLRVLLRRSGLAAIHVTHDHDEAFALADRIAVLGAGRIDRLGTPDELWEDPRTVHAARCLGHENLVVLDDLGNCPLGRYGTGPGTVMVRVDRVALTRAVSRSTGIPGTVVSVVRRAGGRIAVLSLGGGHGKEVLIRVPFEDDGLSLTIGMPVEVLLGEGAVALLSDS